jgi:hypothetical protein
MSHQERSYMVEFLYSKTTISPEKIMSMTDAEVEYYHWLYSDEQNEDYVRVH